MNIDSLVNNAFFLSTNQRNPYKFASAKRKNDDNNFRQDLNVVAKKHQDLKHQKAASPNSTRSNAIDKINKFQVDDVKRDLGLVMAPSVSEFLDQ
jgi:hypothetical protein